jgi:hypothetical protein
MVESKVIAVAYEADGTVNDHMLTWETAQTFAAAGYRVVAVADDGFMDKDAIQRLVDYEYEIALDCFGADYAK